MDTDVLSATDLMSEFHETVLAFKRWALEVHPDKGEDNDSGEWEYGNEFDRMYDSFRDVVTYIDSKDITEETIDDLLYAIARDNECPTLINEISSGYFVVLCRAVLDTPYINAKWEFAEALKDHGEDENVKPLIFRFLDTGDEYTERMALMSLSYLYPERTEGYAEKFWSRNIYKEDEYQKIMVLHALYNIGSPKLSYYLDLADHSSLIYLKENAEAIRERLRQPK